MLERVPGSLRSSHCIPVFLYELAHVLLSCRSEMIAQRKTNPAGTHVATEGMSAGAKKERSFI